MVNKKALLAIFILAIFIRAFPLFIGSMTGPDPWFHARMTEMVVEGQAVPGFDSLSMQGRFYSYAPLFHTTIASFSILSGIEVINLTPILPAIYGAVAVLLAFAFTRRFFKSQSIALFASLAIALMPLHLMRTAAYARPDSLALLIVPAIIFLIYIKKFSPALLLTVALVLLHPLSSLYLFIFLIVWMIVARVKHLDFNFRKTLLIILICTIIWMLWLYSLPYSPLDYVSSVSLESSENVKPLLLSIFIFFTFSWIFLVLGLVKSEARKKVFLLSWFFFSLLYAAFSSRLAIFLTMPVAIISAAGFGLAFEKTRSAFPVLLALLFVLGSMVAFSEVSNTRLFVSPSERAAMAWLSNTPLDSVIFSSWDRGHPLTYLSRRQVVMDGYFEFAPGLSERNDSMQVLVRTSNCVKILAERTRWDFDFFFLHKRALESAVYKNGLLEADCKFISTVYSSDSARILSFR